MTIFDDWRKSSLSFANGNCVEVSSDVAVRDTTDREGTILVFTPSAWKNFISGIKSL